MHPRERALIFLDRIPSSPFQQICLHNVMCIMIQKVSTATYGQGCRESVDTEIRGRATSKLPLDPGRRTRSECAVEALVSSIKVQCCGLLMVLSLMIHSETESSSIKT
jgi:hypothetical protein